MKIYKGGPTKFAALENLRLRGKFCDVILRVGSNNIQAHKVVLLTLSPYFFSEFTGLLSDENQRLFVLKDVNYEATASLVQFAYTGELRVDINNVQPLYFAADYFQIEKAKGFCEDFIIENLVPKNVLGVRQLGELIISVALTERVNTFISNRFVEVSSVANDEFLALEKNRLVGLLSRSDLVVISENDVWNALKVWIDHDKLNRGKFIYELLQKVRLSLVDSEDLDIIAEYPLIASSIDCMNRIDDARTYKLEPCRRDDIDVGETTRRGYPEGKVYIFGGVNVSEVTSSKIDKIVGDRLEQKSNMQIKRAGHGVAVLNGNIHITGGFDAGKIFKSCEMYSPSNDKSVLIKPMNFKRSMHGCCAHKGKVYVCGGKDGFASDCCERLETNEGKWRFIASMNVERISFAAVSCGEHIWVFGGCDFKNKSLDSSEFYDENKAMWKMSTPMTQGRSMHSAVAFRSNIYLLGGLEDQVEIFDTVMQQFTRIRSMRFSRCYFGATISGEKIYCLGGYENGAFDSVDSFNLITREWKREATLPQNLFGIAAVTSYEA